MDALLRDCRLCANDIGAPRPHHIWQGAHQITQEGDFMSTRSRGIGLRTRAAVITAASVATVGVGFGISAAPASASVHRGVSGCFAWSWGDGNTSVTTYWHNRCTTTHKLKIKYSLSWTTKTYTAVVKGNAKGHKKLQTASIVSITDGGRA